MIYLCHYLAAINLATFILYGIDKYKAMKGRWRIPEARLLLMAIVGGSIGALMGMWLWHHKTRHAKFRYGVPFILAMQILAAAYLFAYR